RKARQTRTSPADAISWSGCKDSQTSADAVEAGSATGAMSYAFITALTQHLSRAISSSSSRFAVFCVLNIARSLNSRVLTQWTPLCNSLH
ncbi:hypothetical protein EDB86DRAFT_3024953, partial [Lactarius hatsudake]